MLRLQAHTHQYTLCNFHALSTPYTGTVITVRGWLGAAMHLMLNTGPQVKESLMHTMRWCVNPEPHFKVSWLMNGWRLWLGSREKKAGLENEWMVWEETRGRGEEEERRPREEGAAMKGDGPQEHDQKIWQETRKIYFFNTKMTVSLSPGCKIKSSQPIKWFKAKQRAWMGFSRF